MYVYDYDSGGNLLDIYTQHIRIIQMDLSGKMEPCKNNTTMNLICKVI